MSDQPEQLSGNDPADERAVHSLAARYGRRALILGAAAASAGLAADLVAGGTAEAAPDSSPPVLLGKLSHANGSTTVDSKHANGLVGQTVTNGFSGVAGLDFNPTKHSHGIYGQTNHGIGVFGVGLGGGHGVGGNSNSAGHNAIFGVDEARSGGCALLGQSRNGLALHAEGKVKFSISGVVTMDRGQRSTKVQVSGMAPTNKVFATIQQAQSGVYIEGAQAGKGSFTLTLSKNLTAQIHVAWFVLE